MPPSRTIRAALRRVIRDHPYGPLLAPKPISNLTIEELCREIEFHKITKELCTQLRNDLKSKRHSI